MYLAAVNWLRRMGSIYRIKEKRRGGGAGTLWDLGVGTSMRTLALAVLHAVVGSVYVSAGPYDFHTVRGKTAFSCLKRGAHPTSSEANSHSRCCPCRQVGTVNVAGYQHKRYDFVNKLMPAGEGTC